MLNDAAAVIFIGDSQKDMFAFVASVTDECYYAIVRRMHNRFSHNGGHDL